MTTGTAKATVAAVDLGAESGRVAQVGFDGERLTLDVVHRFTHTPREVDGVLRWNLGALEGGIREGLGALANGDTEIASVGVDGWGVDYGLSTRRRPRRRAHLLPRPAARSSPSTRPSTRSAPTASTRPPASRSSRSTPSSPSPPTPAPARPARRASSLLMLPDVFHHLLSGSRVTEYSAASTTGCYDMAANALGHRPARRLGVPTHMLPEVVRPAPTSARSLPESPPAGSGPACRHAARPRHRERGRRHPARRTPTASTSPRAPGRWWASRSPTRSSATTPRNGTSPTRAGMRARSGCCATSPGSGCSRRAAASGRRRAGYSYPELVALADEAAGLDSIVNPDAPEFLDGRDAPARIQAYCASPGHGAGDARRDRPLRPRLAGPELPRRRRRPRGGDRPPIPSVNIVGGGSNNTLLSSSPPTRPASRFTAAPSRPPPSGTPPPSWSPSASLADLADIRRVIAGTTDMTSYAPTPHSDRWDDAYAHFTRLLARDRERPDLGPSEDS